MKKSPNYRRNQTGSSLFENAQTLEALSKQGNPLAFISKMIDFEMFRPILESKLQTTERKSNAGRKPVFTKEMKDIYPYWKKAIALNR